MYNLIIAGSRSFRNFYEANKITCQVLSKRNPKDICIISGGAKGGDEFGEWFAKKHGTSLRIFPADWDTYGKSAGHIRNGEMAEVGDGLLLFWDGVSKGSNDMFWKAHTKNIPILIVYFDVNTQEIIKIEDETNPF